MARAFTKTAKPASRFLISKRKKSTRTITGGGGGGGGAGGGGAGGGGGLLRWLLFALLIAALIIGLIFLLKSVIPTGGDGGTTTPPAGVIDQNAVLGEGEISIPDTTKTRGRQIKVYGIPELPLAANTKEQSFVFSNPEENPCFFVIEIELSDTGEVIYTSNLLPPGYSISKLTLTRALAAGTYPATIHVKTYSFDKEQRKLNNMDLKTTIVVS